MFIAEDGTVRYSETLLGTYQTTRCQPMCLKFRLVLEPTQPSMQKVPRSLLGGKAAGV